MRARTLAALVLVLPLVASAVATRPARAQDAPPVVTAPATVVKPQGCTIDFTVTATAVPGATIVSLTASPLPSGATFTVDPSNTSGVFHWVAGFGSSGVYNITFTAVDSQSLPSSAITSITITQSARAPVVTAPASASVKEGSCLSIVVSAVDPDGDRINCFSPSPILPLSSFTTNAALSSATFTWCPALGSAGIYTVTFTAGSDICGGTGCDIFGSATTMITVTADRPPGVSAPSVVIAPLLALTTFTVTASDPDGDAIASLTAAGTAITAGGTFATNATHTSGTFSWTPGFTQQGSYSVTFTASNALSGSATTSITASPLDFAPVVTAPTSVSGSEGTLITFTVSASDANGDAIVSLTAFGAPVGATFTSNASHTSGTFSWTPNYTQAGSYTVTFTATNALSGSATTAITVADACAQPVADAGGPYSGAPDAPITFDASGSSDPGGSVLTYAWDFGDGSTGVGVSVSHTYAVAGTYPVTLTVQNGCGMSATTQTTATLTQFCALAFTSGGNKTLRLDSGKRVWCAEVQPINNCYANADVILSSIVMQFTGGTVSQIHAITGKTAVTGDSNQDGIEEITACFQKDDLRALFSGLPAGENTVTVTIRMDLVGGGHADAQLTMRVFSSGPALAASVSPNPFNPRATLSFRTTQEGFARARLYDASGRLVRTLLDERSLAPGYHDVPLDGRGDGGAPLASGVYHYRLETAEGIAAGRVVLLK